MENGEVLAFIEDGYTQSAYLKAESGIHPDVRFNFRPMTFQEVQQLNSQLAQYEFDHDKRAILAAEVIQRKVASWDIKDRQGQTKPIEAGFIIRSMRPVVTQRIYNIVSGLEAGDVDRSAGAGYIQRLQDEADRKSPAEQEEAALKN
jgi:hypothetical protein